MRIQSHAGLVVELPDSEFLGREKTLTLAGRIYKSRRWLDLIPVVPELLRLMDTVNRVRRELGLSERDLSVADDPMRDLEEISDSDIEWNTMIAGWCPNWQISAPNTWGMHS